MTSNVISPTPTPPPNLFHADRQTDRDTGVTKLTIAFRNFANAPEHQLVKRLKRLLYYTTSYRKLRSMV